MAEGKKSFIAYSDWKETFDNLSNEYAGLLIKHIFAYVNDEDPKSEEMIINAVFPNIKNTLKRDLDKWDNQIEQRRNAGKKSAEVRATKSNERSIPLNETERNPTVSVNDNVSVSVNVNDILLKKETKEILRFKIPTVFEIQEYCTERQNTIDAENFFNFYESKGWMVGKAKMKDWKASVRTWEKSKNNNQQQTDLKNEPKIGRMPISVALKNATGWGDIEI